MADLTFNVILIYIIYNISILYIIKGSAVRDYIKEFLQHSEEKFLVFAYHTSMLDSVEKACNDSKVKYIRIDGQTDKKDRQNLVNRF